MARQPCPPPLVQQLPAPRALLACCMLPHSLPGLCKLMHGAPGLCNRGSAPGALQDSVEGCCMSAAGASCCCMLPAKVVDLLRLHLAHLASHLTCLALASMHKEATACPAAEHPVLPRRRPFEECHADRICNCQPAQTRLLQPYISIPSMQMWPKPRHAGTPLPVNACCIWFIPLTRPAITRNAARRGPG